MRVSPFTALVAATATLALAACGGGGGNPSGGGGTSAPGAGSATASATGTASAPGTAPAMSPAAGSEATETSEPTEAPAGGEAGGTVSITHTQGTTEVPLNPERVVVLDFGVLDTISAIGAEDSVVGTVTATLPEWLDEYADATNVGTLQEPDLEALTLLDPDLVIVGFRSAAQYQTLSANWPTVDVTFVAAEGWQEGVAEAAGIIGQIYGAEEQVAEGIHELEREIESVSATIPEDNRTLVLSTSAGEVTTYGPASRFGLIYSVLGMDPALENVADDPHGQVISFETIAETNPDWIFVNDRDAAIGAGTAGQAAGEVLNTPLVTGTTAWTEDQVIYLDPARWYIVQHGLENSVEMVREIGEALTQ